MAGKLTLSLVVLMLLGALLAVGAASPLEQRNRASCVNNLRQVCLAMLMYATDNDDMFPDSLDADAATSGAQRRLARLISAGYLVGTKVFKCPSTPKDNPPDAEDLDGGTLRDSTPDSIADVYLNDEWASYGVDPRANKTYGGARALLADRPHFLYWGTGVSSPEAGKVGSNSENHKGEGQNLCYIDGHVAWSATCKDDCGVDPNVFADDPKDVVPDVDDANIDFGAKPKEDKDKDKK